MLGISAGFIGALGLFLRRSRGRIDKVAKGYEGFCGALARAGLPRERWEGAQHFGVRAAREFPAQAAFIERVSGLYVSLRYGREPKDPKPFLDAVRRLPRFTPTPSGK
jgi:hypothetical protein